MRRGQTALVFDSCGSMTDLLRWFVMFLRILKSKMDKEVAEDDPTIGQARKVVAANLEMCEAELQQV